MSIAEPYEKLFGFVPLLTQTRHEFSAEVFPEILALHEEFRQRCMHSEALEEKTAQLVLFAMLGSQLRSGARVHAIASRRAGATWKELHAVCNLIYLFAGLSAMNFSVKIIAEIKKEEEKNTRSNQ
jgi:alkylhydroperoxidase/carboxymuconolactone decarboxylase family protein YurZ